MTDQDNLRDRIAAKILDNFNPPDDKHPSWWINPEASAQAIIDELGLTMEAAPGHDPRECECSSRAYSAESRVVGKWERKNENDQRSNP